MTLKKASVALALLMSATSVSFATGVTNSSNAAPPSSTQGVAHHAMQPRHRAMHSGRLYNYAPSGLEQTAPGSIGQAVAPAADARAAALQDCSAKANKWSSSAWQTTQLAIYRGCMSEHGQAG